jgi:hypothetical protein
VPQFEKSPIDERVGLDLEGVHIAPHGETPQTATRPQPARQADCRSIDGGSVRIGDLSRNAGDRVCQKGRFEGRQSPSRSPNQKKESRNSANCCGRQVGSAPEKTKNLISRRKRILSSTHPFFDSKFAHRQPISEVEGGDVTVCIAARSGAVILGASDRMLTSGDVQFEPSSGTKIIQLTSSVFVMTAGDAALQGEVVSALMEEVGYRLAADSSTWFRVQEAADIYIEKYNDVRNKRAESAILSPLFMDKKSFVSEQKLLADNLASDLSKELLNFSMPSIAAIIAGVDNSGCHIYMIQEGETSALEANCVDTIGFAAIGIGRRHASSQFMFARHAWNSPLADTLLLTYHAKKKSEVAPGVGRGTDMVMVNGLGGFTILGDHVLGKLEQEHQKIIQEENAAFSTARGEIARYVEDLGKQAEAAAAAATTQQPPTKIDDTTKPPDGT